MNPVLYDTTLRDGTQQQGLSLSLEDKLKIAKALDQFGIHYIEGGWPGSNPKDQQFFEKAGKMAFQSAKLVAFGSTRRARSKAGEDRNLQALCAAETPAVAVVGKAWLMHVHRVLNTEPTENLAMIRESVAWLKQQGREVIFDAEHFFDGYRADPAYALAALAAAEQGGADWLVLCDTNGGNLPSGVAQITAAVKRHVTTPIGIHAHNDCELAVANSLSAVEHGCQMIQGTINGYGERCGNANLVSLIPTLQLKLNKPCIPPRNMRKLKDLSGYVHEIANLNPRPQAAYVGSSAFAHKGGIHVSAVAKCEASYEHIRPGAVGNRRQIVVSELSGKVNIRSRAKDLGLDVANLEPQILKEVKEREARGFQFEAADGSFEMLIRRQLPGYQPYFQIKATKAVSEQLPGIPTHVEATVQVHAAGETFHMAAMGAGPVHALDRALRKALLPCFPQLAQVRLVDYKVRILDPDRATAATTRVLIEAAAGTSRWTTIGCSQDIVSASARALGESFEVYLHRQGIAPATTHFTAEGAVHAN